MPATGFETGTPASYKAKRPPQTEAIELEPFDSKMSDTIRIVYGKLSSSGRTGASERLASAPWPISRRPGPRSAFGSPVENPGKL